jgi:hypothetical protein
VLAVAAAAALGSLMLGACGESGGGSHLSTTRGPCLSSPPGKAATYANASIAFARDAGTREGEEVQSTRLGGELPWFAKFGLYVRGNQEVVVRVPARQRDVVKIRGWGSTANELHTDILVPSMSGCRAIWSVYPGGLVFSGRRCVRLVVEGPGSRRGSALFGLRRDCSA